ncbi:dnaJ homolog subfamily C member 21 isoform X1 [Trichogramma pretiosum]|uniref:dnaJ homolog subfamily C member 21 isoform X1 n=1 Tax=Trichogramma pretiosum TaxID=7493 RepID=UPI000C719C2B|nr:dnaJ homolog subfamily C member 21 isoform X1 [Trichogramma pretiosum]
MKCHYEILELPRNATDEEIKKSYRKLALKWHPDKNPDNQSEAKEQFQLVQQAYEVLSDPHERAWYDNHREAILKGGIGEDYQDDSLDVFPYFSSSCFKGYGDDEKGFYTVYRKVFEKLAAEDEEFSKGDSDEEPAPGFGDSNTVYEDVHRFYGFWQSYITKRSFSWLDPWNITKGPNRWTVRQMEKENKKVRDAAKKERNEQIRNLVAFVRKRDKRVQAHAKLLEEKSKANKKKHEERKRQQLLQRQEQLKNQKESEWSKFSNIQSELERIEASLAEEFGEELTSDEDKDIESEESNALYCVACTKLFKTSKAFSNHENSKKHKDNVAKMTASLVDDDINFPSSEDESEKTNSKSSLPDDIKPATGHGMPDFLLNPPTISKDNDDDKTSDGEKYSDDEKDEKANRSRHLPDGSEPATGHGMPDFLLDPPTITKDNDDDKTSDGEKYSDDEKDEKANRSTASNITMDAPPGQGYNDDRSKEEGYASDTPDEELISDQEDVVVPKSKKKKRKKTIRPAIPEDTDDDDNMGMLLGLSKKQRKKQQQQKLLLEKLNIVQKQPSLETDSKTVSPNSPSNSTEGNQGKGDESEDDSPQETVSPAPGKKKGKKAKELRKAQRQAAGEARETNTKKMSKIPEVDQDLDHTCVSCKQEFPSKNKLFDHLKKTGHSVYIPEVVKVKKSEKSGKGKSRSKNDSD